MGGDLRKLRRLIEETETLVDCIEAESGNMQVVERNVERMRASLKMLRIGIVEPLEIGG